MRTDLVVAAIGIFGSIAATLAVLVVKEWTPMRIGSGLVACAAIIVFFCTFLRKDSKPAANLDTAAPPPPPSQVTQVAPPSGVSARTEPPPPPKKRPPRKRSDSSASTSVKITTDHQSGGTNIGTQNNFYGGTVPKHEEEE